MIILDTNVLSPLMQRRPDTTVINWLDKQPAEAIWICSITLFEARYGLNLLAEGDRRSMLIARFDEIPQTNLANRILVLNVRAATKSAELAATRKKRVVPSNCATPLSQASLWRMARRWPPETHDTSRICLHPWLTHGNELGNMLLGCYRVFLSKTFAPLLGNRGHASGGLAEPNLNR
jgi:predicted nucleic acid-binding protein